MENLGPHKPLSSTRSVPLDGRTRAHTMLSSAESEDDVFEKKPRRVRIDPKASPVTVRGRSSTVGSSGDELKGKRKKSARKRTLSKENLDNPKDDLIRKKRGFFGFGKSKPKRKANEDAEYYSDKECKLINVKAREENEKAGAPSDFVREDSWRRRPAGSFSREHYTRRSTRDIIREMEARAIGNGISNNDQASGKALDSKIREKEGAMKRKNNDEEREVEERQKIKKEDEKKKHREEEKKRKEEERKKKDDEKRKHEEEKKKKEEEEKARKKTEEEIKKREQANNLLNKKAPTTPANKKSKKQALLDEIAK